MGPGYLIVLKGTGASTQSIGVDLDLAQRTSGLELGTSTPGLDVLVNRSTDLIKLPGGALLVGRIFTREGKRIRDASSSLLLGKPLDIRSHLMKSCWGQYVLIQPGNDPRAPITVFRDPSGGLPCVYSTDSTPAFITSDISLPTSLGLYERSIDWDAIRHCLNYPHFKTQQTALKGVSELLPGCEIKLGGHAYEPLAAWSPWTFIGPEARFEDARQAARTIRQTVEMVVRAMTADEASILVELSGGLDSSIVASCLRDASAELYCSTLLTPVPGADERFYAELVASSLGTSLNVENLAFNDALFDFPPVCGSTSPAVTMLQLATDRVMDKAAGRHAATCHLSGGGGDTVFGYLGNASPAADAFRAKGIATGFRAIKDLAEMHRCTSWKAGRLTLKKLLQAPRPAPLAETMFLSPHAVVSEPCPHPWLNAPASALPGERERVFDLASTQAFIEGLPRSRLRPFHMPLLSQPVVEACLRVPSWMWIASGINRAVARDAFADALPPQIVSRRSKGTFAPFTGALFRRSRLAMLDFLLEGELQRRGLLDDGALSRFFHNEHHARNETFARAFDLCMIENWVRHQH